MRVTAVTLSAGDLYDKWKLENVPLYCHTDGYNPKYHSRREQTMNRERVEYMTQRRNRANSVALELFPDTRHILAIDSYYLEFVEPIRALMQRYASLCSSGDCIVGAATWWTEKVRLRDNRTYFYDTWSTPEMKGCCVANKSDMPTGIRRVSSVGACYIYPRWVWEKHGYQIPEPFPKAGIFHNWLCQKSGLPVFLDFDAKLWRSHDTNPDIPEYGLIKRIRISLHIRRVLGKKSLKNGKVDEQGFHS